jgi:hypothetical protein
VSGVASEMEPELTAPARAISEKFFEPLRQMTQHKIETCESTVDQIIDHMLNERTVDERKERREPLFRH